MHEPIRHRGPDGEGFLLVDPKGRWERWEHLDASTAASPVLLGMAFRRLKILDLTDAAAQPMPSADGSRWLTFNGEIYNFGEVRAELSALGYRFRSSGDSEVILAAFDAWGEGCFERLDGMWAIVIADLPRRRLVVSRDRFGIKPLYWAADGEAFLLASEIKQILRAAPARSRAHAPLVGMFLRGVRFPCLEETFFQGIRAVPPATWFEVPFDGGQLGAPTFRTYWDLSRFYCAVPDDGAPAYADAVERFESLLEAAVASHDVADVRVGSLLSGGLDSSTLACLLAERARRQGRPCPTFSLGYRDKAPRYCEMPYVDAIVKRHGLENHETTLDATWVLRHAPDVVRTLEEPPLAMPALAQYRVFQLCREHDTTVVFDGQAADEVLAGYPYHQRLLLQDRLGKLRVSDFARELWAIRARREATALLWAWESLLRPAMRRYAPRAGWVAGDYGARQDTDELSAVARDASPDPSLVNRRLYYDVRWGNVKIVLGYSDKNAMAHSVEARVPYLDRRLVELAFSMPDTFKVGRGERKRILRDVARRILPPEVTERRDRLGFGVPDREMLRGTMWPAVRTIVTAEPFVSAPCFDMAAVRRFIRDYEASRHDDFRGIWRLYALALWQEAFDVVLG